MKPTRALLAAVLFALPLAAQRPERIELGPLTLEVHLSRTAHLFHVVDQLSAWDNACHGQYRAHMELDEADERMLARHAAVRRERRWGQGLEQTFYTAKGLDDAIRAGVRAEHVTRGEADEVREVLEYFADRIDELFEAKRPVLAGAFERVASEHGARVTAVAESLARFTGERALVVPVFPIASPAPGGGGMDGGRLKWELNSEELPVHVLVHELVHAYLAPSLDRQREVVRETPGLNLTLLGEGFAYAIAPGMFGPWESDVLAANAAADRRSGNGFDDFGSYEWQRWFGLALRPSLSEALESSTLDEYLPHARSVFLALRDLERAPEPPKLATAGPAYGAVRERLDGARFHLWIHSFPHEPGAYAEFLDRARAADLFVVLATPDALPPAGFDHVLPIGRDELERRLERGREVEAEHSFGGLRVVLLGAASEAELAALVARSAHVVP